MSEIKKYYKVLDKNNKAQNGGKFDYTEYIKSKKPLPRIENPIICESGYHITEYWNMWLDDKTNKIYEVEPIDIIEESVIGVQDKVVCKSFKFIKQFKPKYNNKLNIGNWNTGDKNTGNWNTGNSNTGNRNIGNRNIGNWNTGYKNTGNSNTGNWNTGYRNTGNWNIGNWNTGYRNTGNWNIGNWNTGYKNTGNWNTGDKNTGNSNTGNSNTGNRNTGDWNTGYKNTGDWNTGYKNTGSFNTKRPKYTQLFNKNILFSEYDKISFPAYFYFVVGTDYKKSWKKSFNGAKKEDIQKTVKLPNFNYKVFEEITGISKKMINERLKE